MPRLALQLTRFWGGEILDVRWARSRRRILLSEGGVPEAGGQVELLCPSRIGETEWAHLGPISVAVTCIDGVGRTGRTWFRDGAAWISAVLSLVAHVYVLAALGLSTEDLAESARARVSVLRAYLVAADERDSRRPPDPVAQGSAALGDEPTGTPGGTGARAAGERGRLGSRVARSSSRRFAVDGEKHVETSREKASAARASPWVDLITLSVEQRPPRVSAFARDPLLADGAMWAPRIGEGWGEGSLGLTGTGLGGGGTATGIGLGSIGTVGHGEGNGFGGDRGDGGLMGGCDDFCMGQHGGAGAAWGRIGGLAGGRPVGSHARGPTLGCAPYDPVTHTSGCTMTGDGRLPPEVIQRIVRANYGRLRFCYESALQTNPSLEGRVVARFTIGRDGNVTDAVDGGSELAAPSVVACAIRVFASLTFPAPVGGDVTVRYPVVLSTD